MNALKPRPPFQALVMMEQCGSGASSIETAYALRHIADAGVRIFFYLTDTELKRDTADRQFLIAAPGLRGRHAPRADAAQRTRDALRRQAERGHVAGGAGLRLPQRRGRAGDAESRRCARSYPSQAAVVRRIFREIAAGRSGSCASRKRLNADGVPRPRPQKRGWAASACGRCARAISTGACVVYGRTRWEDRDGTQVKVRDPAERVDHGAGARSCGSWTRRCGTAAHARLARTRAAYARLTGGAARAAGPRPDRVRATCSPGSCAARLRRRGVRLKRRRPRRAGPGSTTCARRSGLAARAPAGGLRIQRGAARRRRARRDRAARADPGAPGRRRGARPAPAGGGQRRSPTAAPRSSTSSRGAGEARSATRARSATGPGSRRGASSARGVEGDGTGPSWSVLAPTAGPGRPSMAAIARRSTGAASAAGAGWRALPEPPQILHPRTRPLERLPSRPALAFRGRLDVGQRLAGWPT